VLGCAILHDSGLRALCSRCTEDDFHNPGNKTVFRAIYGLYLVGDAVDYISTETAIAKTPGTSPPLGYIDTLISNPCSPVNVAYHIGVLVELSVARGVYDAMQTKLSALEAGSKPGDVLAAADQAVSDAYDRLKVRSSNDVSLDSYSKLEKIQSGETEYVLLTGVPSLDRFMPSIEDLWILAARPSMGKTGFALWLAERLATRGVSVLFCSIEMSAQKILYRRWAMAAGIDSTKFRYKDGLSTEDWQKVTECVDQLNKRPLYIRDDLASVGAIISEMRAVHYGLVVIDYLQLMPLPNKKNMVYELGDIANALKGAAKRVQTPVMLLSQLSRLEKGSRRKPRLSDLRSSGELEQTVDCCWMIHKEERTDEDAEILFRKHRDGPTGNTTLRHDLITGNFHESY
jgi:replicative DNA helicase